uniref:Uncharacterized protein n=1 Tax=Paramormyrops kingsleyae TaxID=1676925 RepID=A0A3B3RV73_9TELE
MFPLELRCPSEQPAIAVLCEFGHPFTHLPDSAPQYRSWLRSSYSHNSFKDQERVEELLRQYKEQQQLERQRNGQQNWMSQVPGLYPLPY